MQYSKQIASQTGQIAVLLDPDKLSTKKVNELIRKAEFAQINYFFVGGSSGSREQTINLVALIKSISQIPVILFPGSSDQISLDADAILLLNLISGRNPDFLIGHHIQAAEILKNSSLEIISTSYLLIDGGSASSVSYVSQTTPIPRNQLGIIRKTIIAGEQIGHKVCFLDAGSGAQFAVSDEIIKEVRMNTTNPIIVGGGIRTIEQIKLVFEAGANIAVIGNQLEENFDLLLDIQLHQTQKTT